MPQLSELDFIDVPAGTYLLGVDVQTLPEPRFADHQSRFSPVRRVTLPAFKLATTTVGVEALLADHDAAFLACDSLADVVVLLDKVLASEGLSLPTEDQLEAALGDGLFPWGATEVPPDCPYASKLTLHRGTMPSGLVLDGDTYQTEVVNTALKLGDGGEAVCGGYPWPIAWLSLSTPYRLTGDVVEDVLFEHLETSSVRPLKRFTRGEL